MGNGNSIRKPVKFRGGNGAGSVIASPFILGWVAFSKALENRYSAEVNAMPVSVVHSNANLQAVLPWASY